MEATEVKGQQEQSEPASGQVIIVDANGSVWATSDYPSVRDEQR
jgi:hypothetical protein